MMLIAERKKSKVPIMKNKQMTTKLDGTIQRWFPRKDRKQCQQQKQKQNLVIWSLSSNSKMVFTVPLIIMIIILSTNYICPFVSSLSTSDTVVIAVNNKNNFTNDLQSLNEFPQKPMTTRKNGLNITKPTEFKVMEHENEFQNQSQQHLTIDSSIDFSNSSSKMTSPNVFESLNLKQINCCDDQIIIDKLPKTLKTVQPSLPLSEVSNKTNSSIVPSIHSSAVLLNFTKSKQQQEEKESTTKNISSNGISLQHKSDLIGRLACEYGTVRKYLVNTVVQWRLSNAISLKFTLVTKCLNQITWGNSNELEDKLNGQKYLALIGDFHIGPNFEDDTNFGLMNNDRMIKRSKRGLYRYIEHLWKDFKNMLSPERGTPIPHDDFDNDMIESMENEIENNRKCHYEIPNKYWDSPSSKYYLYYGSERCINCNTIVNPFSKMSLPFWFIQLQDGSIPQIRFCKQETNIEIKNWKKYLISLFMMQLNSSNQNTVEKSWLGIHRSHYHVLSKINMDISTNARNLIQINKHIQSKELTDQQQDNNNLELNNINNNEDLSANIESNQTYTIDKLQSTIIELFGNSSIKFDRQNELWTYLEGTCHFYLKMSRTLESKHDDTMKVLNERFAENSKETLVAQMNKQEVILLEKYSKLLARMRNKLGKNEYRYYTTLYESATSKLDSEEHDSLLELITLEQKLNHTVHQHNSIIGDIRRIGTAHNIQLVCGVNMVNIGNEKCFSFILLLLKSSSKTAQRDLLYALQNTNQLKDKENTVLLVARLLSHTNKPSRWFIENLLHETYHQTTNEQLEATLLQSLTLLSQNEQLLKLREMLSIHIVKRIEETLNIDMDIEQKRIKNLRNELFLVDLIKMLGNLDNYTAIESVHKKLASCLEESTFLTIATIHAYRRSINRSQVQNYLGELFHVGSCQIKQEIVQLLIDNVDLIFLEQATDKRWPKYSFNQLDQILAQNLRNSSNNCVHHLIVEYFKRKINNKSMNYIKEFEVKQNYDASSFDFCINESTQVKCDYVQKVGTDMVSMSIRKSISTTKILNINTNNTASRTNTINSPKQPEGSYTKYSIDLTLLKNKLTLGHLNVIQSVNSSRLHLEFDSYRGQTIAVASLNVSKNMARNGTIEIAQVKINIPEIIVWAKRYLHFDYSLLVQVNLLLSLKLIPIRNISFLDEHGLHARSQLKINFDIKSSAEILSTSLVSKSSIELNSRFKYESLQPMTVEDSSLLLVYQNHTVLPSISNASFQYLGSEWFHHEIELFKEFNKRYDPQCNTWIDESYKQTLSLWNSTLVQKNLLSLSFEGQGN